ncbi:MAG: phosphatidate cytidylyltransferase [Bacteroidota bacterium]|nr:phosphatidate cytidylyltransferase [Bacteroidota bacterium]
MSNLTKRIIAGIIGIPVIIGAAYLGGIYFLIFSIIVSSLALWEFYKMFERKGFAPLKYFLILVSFILLIFTYSSENYLPALFILLTAGILTLEIYRIKGSPINPMISLFGIFYITFPFVMLNMLLEILNFNIVIYIFILIWTCDTAAYFGGRKFGKHQLSSISPKKTWEGSAAGFIFTIIISLLIHFIFPGKLNRADAISIGVIVGIFSQVGDLFESLIKRYCDVKDSSKIIPGHGGMLDRFDSLIFVTPVIFVYFVYIK